MCPATYRVLFCMLMTSSRSLCQASLSVRIEECLVWMRWMCSWAKSATKLFSISDSKSPPSGRECLIFMFLSETRWLLLVCTLLPLFVLQIRKKQMLWWKRRTTGRLVRGYMWRLPLISWKTCKRVIWAWSIMDLGLRYWNKVRECVKITVLATKWSIYSIIHAFFLFVFHILWNVGTNLAQMHILSTFYYSSFNCGTQASVS